MAAPNTDGGVAVVGSPVTYGVAAPFTMASGATNYAQAVMLPVTQNSTLALDLRRGESAAMRPLVHPSAALTFNGFFVGAIPLGAAKGQAIDYDGYPILMQIYGPAADTTTLSLNVAYGNPFPASWPLMGGSFAQFTTTHALAGGQQVPMRHNVVGFEDTAALNAGPHRPRISPPLGLQVNGVTGDQTLTGSGLTITWGAPTIGTPNSYRVNVNRLFLSGATPTSELAAFLITDRTSARIPVGTLAAGQRYVVQVYAITNPGNDPKAAPFRSNAFPYAYAATAGGTLILP